MRSIWCPWKTCASVRSSKPTYECVPYGTLLINIHGALISNSTLRATIVCDTCGTRKRATNRTQSGALLCLECKASEASKALAPLICLSL